MLDKLIHILKIRPLLFELRLRLLKSTYTGKVFCTGFNKTGTTSMGSAFRSLGYNNLSYNRKIHELYEKGDYDTIMKIAAKFDSFDDIPWNQHRFIPLLDDTFTNSKFIHLEREENAWLKSLKTWHEFLGIPVDEQKALMNYRNHNKIIRAYFKGRENVDFIILDIKEEKDYTKLANFLGKKPTLSRFPHRNKSKQSL